MATYYINADTGDDTTGDGSQGNPWLTFNHTVDNSNADDTIYCQNSTALYVFTDKSIGARTVEGQSVDGVRFHSNGLSVSEGWTSSSNELAVVKNITFTDIISTGSHGRTFSCGSSGEFKFQNCVFKNLSGAAFLYLRGTNRTFTLESCIIYGLSTGHIFKKDGTSSNGVYNITNCLIHHSTTDMLSCKIFGDSNGTVTFNITNTIFYNNQGGSANNGNTNGIYNFNYNCYSSGYSFSFLSGTNNLTDTDPLLIEPDNNNYNLSPSSPCIDAGTLI